MLRPLVSSVLSAALVLAVGCSSKQRVRVPPRIDLGGYQAVGMIQFSSNADGDLHVYASERFLELAQAAQPNVAVLELGGLESVLVTVGSDRIDAHSVREIGRALGVDAVIVGRLEVTDIKPSLKVTTRVESMRLDADVDAMLAVKLYETGSGATRWSDSARGSATVAHASVVQGGRARFDAGDPERAYGSLVEALVQDVTRDLRWRSVRR
jgi:hypothetical protein